MDKMPVILFSLLSILPLPIVAFRKMRWAMKCRTEHARNNEWSAEYSIGMFAILMAGAFALTISPYLIGLPD
jgi:hypothetical protein